jgi:cytochrome oxidase Cu insertion factor (SCO1/SenC/PrrC family)
MIRSGIVVAAVLGLLVAARSECSQPDAKPDIDGAVWHAAGMVPLPQARQAPPLRLSDLSGQTVDLRHLRGRLVMLYFWATW